MAGTMRAQDALAGAQGKVYATQNGVKRDMKQAVSVTTDMAVNKSSVDIMGRAGKGNKPAGWTGTGSLTIYDNTHFFRNMLYNYKETGVLSPFDIAVVNDDGGSAAGRQVCMLKDCTIDGGSLAQLDAAADVLTTDIPFTFDDFEYIETFTELPGVIE